MIKFFKIIAWFEGVSLLVLFFNMLVIKPTNFDIYKMLLFPIGMAHGILFILYIALATLLKIELKWDFKKYFIICIASFLPFGTFYVEKKYLKSAA
jgi:integral membrane protein